MDSKRIQRLAEGARDGLRADIANSLGRITRPGSAERLATPDDVANVERLVEFQGEDALVERIAYTWFNRLCALRFMDARGYTPVGCVTPRHGETMPAILADARQGVLHDEFPLGVGQRRRVLGLLTGDVPAVDPLDEAYALLLLSACDAYGASMGYLFGGGLEYRSAMRLLRPSGLTSSDGVLAKIVDGMDDESCGSVEVLGWLYQYYIAERKKAWNDSKKKATPNDIAAATELFTPDYIVKFLAQNSLGRLWMLNNPDSGLTSRMDYYVEPDAEHSAEFLRVDDPEAIAVCDPACGSGHILVYAFDLLYQMYEEEGYMADEIPQLILENNLWGMEIDPRAAEIASFSLEMCARERDPGFLGRNVDPHVTVLEPVTFEAQELAGLGISSNQGLLDAFTHLTECGSLYVPKANDLADVEDAIGKLSRKSGQLQAAQTVEKLEHMREILRVLAKRFSCVIANPPYMGSKRFDAWTSAWVKSNYTDEKGDLCTCFIRRGLSFADTKGYVAEVTMHSWMFIGSYEKMRHDLIDHHGIAAMAHLGARAFDAIGGEVVQTTATVFTRQKIDERGSYARLIDFKGEKEKSVALAAAIESTDCGWFYRADAEDFKSIPGWPIAYWANDSEIAAFTKGVPGKKLADFKHGMSTGKNEDVVRQWQEVSVDDILFGARNHEQLYESGKKFVPYNKGGQYRRWWGNQSFILGYDKHYDALMDTFSGHRHDNKSMYFKKCMSWSKVSSGMLAMRFFPEGFVFDVAGCSAFPSNDNDLNSLLGFYNSTVCASLMSFMSPTLNFEVGTLENAPIFDQVLGSSAVDGLVSRNISICKSDWDSFETSWGFQSHPLAQPGEPLVERQFARWERECRERFDGLKSNEEELNRIFARIYHMEDEVPIEVPDEKVSARLADEARDVRSLVSYGIGCIFGRYSVDRPGLVLADAGQTADEFDRLVPGSGFEVDEDDVLPVTGLDDVTLEDDAVRRLREWLSYVYGEESLGANVSYIERVLGKPLRAYLAKDFYRDHCDAYSVQGSGKRPIYWMFSSPRGSFQALVYMHRMDRDTVTRVLTDYVRPFCQRLSAHVGVLRATGAARDAATADRYQGMVDELEQWEGDVLYPLAQRHVEINLDDGVRHNYKLFRTADGDALARVAGLS